MCIRDRYDTAVKDRDTAQAKIDEAARQLNSLAEPSVDDAGYSDLKAH